MPRLDQLDHDLLDHLAYQFHVDFYKADLPLAAKRNLIRESVFWHRIKGTPAGVEKIISTFLVNSAVEENWQYGGNPFFFRITTRGLKYLTEEEQFLQLVYEAKNTRSWLEEIIFDLTFEEPQSLYHAAAQFDSGFVTFDPAMPVLDLYQNFAHSVCEFVTGNIIFDSAIQTDSTENNFFVAADEIVSGFVSFTGNFPPANDFYFAVKEKWKNFSGNPVVTFYKHFFDNDEPILDPDQSWLKLYFKFPNNKSKCLTLLNPRADDLSADIVKLSNFAAKKGILLDTSGNPTLGIFRALLRFKTTERVI